MKYEDQKPVDIFTHPKMQKQRAIKVLMGVCSESIRRGFEFGRVGEDKVLRLFFTHPACLQEFNFNKDEILVKMREVYKSQKLMGAIFFNKVEGKIATKIKVNQKKQENINCKYVEKSTAQFQNKATNERLRRIFEDIREIIKNRI